MDDTVQIDVKAIGLVRNTPFEPTRLEQSLIGRLKTLWLASNSGPIPVLDSDICETVLELGADASLLWDDQLALWLSALEDMIETHYEATLND